MWSRHLKKVDGLSSDTEHAYECDSCVWLTYVSPERHADEIKMEFAEHRCEEHAVGSKTAVSRAFLQ